MSNLQKFNQTLTDFNQEVEQLKDVSKAYQKLEQLIEKYNSIITLFEGNSEKLNEINELQKNQQEKVSNSLIEFERQHTQNKSELEKLLENKIEQIERNNKVFYKDFESTIKIKLDDNKSQIKQLIENERKQIKEIFELEFAKNTRDLKSELEKQTELLSKNQKTIKISIWIFGLIMTILSALTVYKLWIV